MQLEVEGPLGLEVLVHEGLGHPGRLGDVVHGGGRVAVLGEERERHVEELAAPGVGGQPAGRPGTGAARSSGSAGSRRLEHRRSWCHGSPGAGTGTAGPSIGPARPVTVSPGRQHRGDPVGQVLEGEVGPGHGQVALQQARIRVRPARRRSRSISSRPNHSKPKAASSRGDRVGADDQGPPVDHRLDGRVAEPLPGRGQGDHVAGPVGVARPSDGSPSRRASPGRPGTGRRPPGARARARSRPRPGRAASRWRPSRAADADARRRCSCGAGPGSAGGPGGRSVADPEGRRAPSGPPALAGPARPAARGRARHGEGVVDGGGGDAPVGQLAPAQLVDGDVAPARVVGGGGWSANCGRCQGRSWWWRTAGRPARTVGHRSRRRRVEREGAEVLDHHQVGAGQRRSRAPSGSGARRRRWPGRAAGGRPGRRRPRCRW